MLGSWKIGRLFGIDIRLHWTFALLLLVALSVSSNPIWVAVFLTGLFTSVLLHELGHSLMAQRFRVEVLDITFWPLGGMARMTEIPETPRVEGLIAIAGPAVNFVLVALFAPLWFLLWSFDVGAHGLVGIFVLVNLALGCFNMVPAFPMDGGRLLRAFLARRGDYLRATERAVRTGRWVAAGMLLVSFLSLFTPTPQLALPIIAAFVYFAGGRELMAVRLRHGMSPFGGGPLFGAFQSTTAPPRQAETWSAAAAPPPAPAASGEAHGEEGARRPQDWEPAPKRAPGSGFSEADLRRLESFPGRLRRPDQEPEP